MLLTSDVLQMRGGGTSMHGNQLRYGEKKPRTILEVVISCESGRSPFYETRPLISRGMRKQNTTYCSRGSGIARARSVTLLRDPPIDQLRYAIQGHLECAVISRGMGKKQPRTIL
jgi:hypothetical protein